MVFESSLPAPEPEVAAAPVIDVTEEEEEGELGELEEGEEPEVPATIVAPVPIKEEAKQAAAAGSPAVAIKRTFSPIRPPPVVPDAAQSKELTKPISPILFPAIVAAPPTAKVSIQRPGAPVAVKSAATPKTASTITPSTVPKPAASSAATSASGKSAQTTAAVSEKLALLKQKMQEQQAASSATPASAGTAPIRKGRILRSVVGAGMLIL